MQSFFASDGSGLSPARFAVPRPRPRQSASATTVAALGALFMQSACMQTQEIGNEPTVDDAASGLQLDLASLNYTSCDSIKSLTSYSVYAKSLIEVANNADVFSGNVGVKTKLMAPLPGGLPGQLTVRANATLSPAEDALANSISLAGTATAGTLHLNTGGGGTHGPVLTPFPLATMPALPVVANVPFDENQITTVQQNSFTTLDTATEYGEVVVREGGTLILDAEGTFNFRRITMQARSSIIANFPVTVGLRESLLTTGANITIGPNVANESLTAKDFVIRTNALPKFETGGAEIPVVRIASVPDANAENHSEVRALLIAPRGLVDIGRHAHFMGAMAADRVLIRANAAIDYEDGIDDGSCRVICETIETAIGQNDITMKDQVSPLGDLPASDYLVKYVAGCMKYGTNYRYSLNAIIGQFSWQLVGATPGEFLFDLPGTEGFNVPSTTQTNPFIGFKTFDECVAANAALPAELYSHPGGPVGVHLNDDPYYDNSATRTLPKWSLTRISSYSCDLPPES